jgi:hypothetical protein
MFNYNFQTLINGAYFTNKIVLLEKSKHMLLYSFKYLMPA